MSFITKRERVFNEYDLFDLPARNEGKLKAYASCTDARAWSHFCSDKSEHLVEIIKRNNQTVRPKYIPTDVIVNTLMSAKNAEIARLKHKIGEFEQMLSAYDQLDLTSEQKGDIANAHAAIKAANKELDDMCLDLDLSGFTEGIDSEAFETGKSRGDELIRYNVIETGRSGRDEIKTQGEEWIFEKEKASTPRKETKSSQVGPPCTCDASTSAHDTQVDEMQETIISKDAKLSAMQNTLAVMEHDVCEPYCIYAHIYTALEKIFGTLCQNGKYKQYLDLLTAGKDTRGIDIKGKILFKMKVLEKFSLALIAPCSQEFSRASKDCSCYRAEVVTTFALTSAENQNPSLDNKRAQLVADIMDNQEMKEILSKESLCLKVEDDQFDECFVNDSFSIDVENLKRLKNLQANYDELLTCYDNLKHERDCLFIRCQKIADLELECESLKHNLREYNELWKEKEYYRKRSEDLDTLKENYFILSEETSNIETKFKSEQEINKKKSQTIDQLRNENIKLEQKIADTSVLFEKQKNVLICKLKECECKIMCQDQQIKSLCEQIDKLLEQDRNKIPSKEDALRSVELIDEIESQKEQIKNLKDDLCYSEEEKQYLQGEFEKKLELINELKLDVEDWKSRYEEVLKNCNYLQMQVDELQDRNSLINQELEYKTSAIDNLNHIICSKSREVSDLLEEVDHRKDENMNLVKQMKNSRESFDQNIASLLNEKKVAINSIITARQESIHLLKHLKNDRDTDPDDQSTVNKFDTLNFDKNNGDDMLVKEIELLHDTNLENINILQNENDQLKKSFELAKNESLILEQRLINQANLLERFETLKESHEELLNEKETLQLEINRSKLELDNLFHDFQLTKKKSESLLDESEDIKEAYAKLHMLYQKELHERNILEKKTFGKDLEIKELIQSLHSYKLERENFLSKLQEIPKLEKALIELQNKYEKLLSEKNILQNDVEIKTSEMKNLYKNLETKIEENNHLENQIKIQQSQELRVNEIISTLKDDNCNMQLDLDAARKESALLLDKMNHYLCIEKQCEEWQVSLKQIKLENENLQKQLNDLKTLQQENHVYSDTLEQALISSREENISTAGSINHFYADLKIEVAKLKEEKLKNRKEMKSLMEKLDESEFIITNLNEDILARDKRISTLENHINELQVEIAALQNDLKEVVESGEELKELSFEKLDQSFRQIEAHQSKATHNMKIELAKLRNEKENLENKLSLTELRTEESDKEKNKYMTVINQLQSERELIIKDIKQLEISSIGDSNLFPSKCTLNEVLTSLERIGKYIINQNYSSEQTLRNVQASSQLLKSKAEEAKTLAEKEQQKIMCEKEQIKKERIEIEKQVEDMKNKIREEKANYEKIIRDLESENLNQQLIFDKIKQSKEEHILKLIDENQTLRGQCDSYDIEVKEIKEKLQYASEQISKKSDLIENTNRALEYKEKLVTVLQKQMDDLKHKPITQESSMQTVLFTTAKDDTCQTDVYYEENTSEINVDAIHCKYSNIISKNSIKLSTFDVLNEQNRQKKNQVLDKHPPDLPINEIQILTANVEPKIDLARNIYLKYKLKRLSPGNLEQHSIASLNYTKFSNDDGETPIDESVSKIQTDPNSSPHKNINSPLNRNKYSIIDIYNTHFSTNSNKISSDIYTDTSNKECISRISDLENKTKHFKEESISDLKNMDSLQSTEKDLFVIYKESDSIYEEQSSLQKIKETNNKHRKKQNKFEQSKLEDNSNTDDNTVEDREDDSIKPKLEINLPRIINDSSSLVTNSDDDKKSLDSCALPPWKEQSHTHEDSKSFGLNLFSIPTSSKNEIKEIFPDNTSIRQYFDNIAQKNIIQSNRVDYPDKNKIDAAFNSNHKLPRVGATILVLQNTKNDNLNVPSEDFNVKSKYGLQYILNTVQNEINPNNNENFSLTLHKSQSIERINMSESSQSKHFSGLKSSSNEHGIVSTYSPLPKAKVDRGTLVKLDDKEDYGNKIKEMSNALENIERHYKKKIEAIKIQYDSNVKSIITEHNQGVRSIQNLHEETLQDIKKFHENEVENLRTMSFEAMHKVEELQIENRCLKSKFNNDTSTNLHEEPTKIPSPDVKRRKCRCRASNRTLTKTNVEAFNVRPRRRSHGPCTCSLDMSISGSIRNIFEQVDVEQRKMGEKAYLQYIVKKILDGNVEALDAQELSFLHLKVCRTWKTKLNIEEAKKIKIDSLETEWNNKQRQNQKHIAELDRQVAEERRRLQEVREALRFSTMESRDDSPESPERLVREAEKDVTCSCTTAVRERRSAGDLTSEHASVIATPWKRKRGKLETNKAVLARMDGCEGRRDKALVTDETPTRMKRIHDRHNTRTHKK